MLINGELIICITGNKIVKEFLIKDLKCVDIAGNSLKLGGNGIKYKNNFIENAKEIKNAIMNKLEKSKGLYNKEFFG